MSSERLPFDEIFLKEKLKSDPTTWETRRLLAHGLYDKQAYEEAAEIIWTTDQIPSTDLDLAFAIRILAKAQPRRAIRLLTAVLELNQGKAVQNMAMANALLHHGLVLQAARFYGAALEADPTLVNPDLEHFVLWSDDNCTMWDLFEKHHPKLGELPWMLRDPKEALRLTSRISLHTTPIYVPELPKAPGESLKHDLYQQEATHQAKITPPPAVTIPIDRVDPKDRLFDATYGASVVRSAPVEEPAAPVTAPAPAPVTPVEPSSSFPARVVFPESPRPAAPFAPAAALVTPAVPILTQPPTPIPVATLVTPGAPPVSAAPPEPAAAALPGVMPFFADQMPRAAAPLPPVAPFFADSTPTQDDPLPAVVPFSVDPIPPEAHPLPAAARAVSFLGDERLTGSIKIPAAPATPSPVMLSVETPASEPEEEKPDTIKKADVPQAFPISQSAVPTTVLRVKWSTAPARPGDAPATPAVAAPMPVPPPVAPPVPPSIPFASPPIPFAQPAAPQPLPVPAAALMPSPLPVPQQEAPEPVPFAASAPTGAPTRALLPSGTPPFPTGAPTRALLPSGTPPANPTGAPTRALLPSGTPPENAGAAPRRLLLTPARPPMPPPAGNEGQ